MIEAKLIQAEFLEMNELTSSNNFVLSLMEASSGPSSAANIRDLFLPLDKVAQHLKGLGNCDVLWIDKFPSNFSSYDKWVVERFD